MDWKVHGMIREGEDRKVKTESARAKGQPTLLDSNEASDVVDHYERAPIPHLPSCRGHKVTRRSTPNDVGFRKDGATKRGKGSNVWRRARRHPRREGPADKEVAAVAQHQRLDGGRRVALRRAETFPHLVKILTIPHANAAKLCLARLAVGVEYPCNVQNVREVVGSVHGHGVHGARSRAVDEEVWFVVIGPRPTVRIELRQVHLLGLTKTEISTDDDCGQGAAAEHRRRAHRGHHADADKKYDVQDGWQRWSSCVGCR